MTTARRELGQMGEDHAAAHFERLGYAVLDRNARTKFGELDLVLTDGRVVVFCEVKTRRAGSGHPWDALTEGKQAQVRRQAIHWLHEHPQRPFFPELRFDAVGVVIDARGGLVSLDHLEGAF